ncbi:MAG: hypothetical protein Q9216_004597 [Gyalolechia sp. 2 TL-2023]
MSLQSTRDCTVREQEGTQCTRNVFTCPHYHYYCPDCNCRQPVFACKDCETYLISLKEQSDVLQHRIRELEAARNGDKQLLAQKDSLLLIHDELEEEFQCHQSREAGVMKAVQEQILSLQSALEFSEERKRSAEKETSKWMEFAKALQKKEVAIGEELKLEKARLTISNDRLFQHLTNNDDLQSQLETQTSMVKKQEATIRGLKEEMTAHGKELDEEIIGRQNDEEAHDSELLVRNKELLQAQKENNRLKHRLDVRVSDLAKGVSTIRALEKGKQSLAYQLSAETLKARLLGNKIRDLEKKIQNLEGLVQRMRLSEEETEKAHNDKQTAKDEELADLRIQSADMEKKYTGEIQESTAEIQKQKDKAEELKAEVQKLKDVLDPKGSTAIEAGRGILKLVSIVAGAPVG